VSRYRKTRATFMTVTICAAMMLGIGSRTTHVEASPDTGAGVSLPWAARASWVFNGPHTWGGNGIGPWNSLDLEGGDRGHDQVLAATAGTAHLDGHSQSCGYVRVAQANGWQTTYVHMTQALVSEGAPVTRGQLLGVTDTNTSCFGSASGFHVHFSIWFVPTGYTYCFGCTQFAVDWQTSNGGQGEQIGDYSWTDGAQEYQGCATQIVTNVMTCWTNYLAQSIYNAGTVAGSACSAGTVSPPNPHTNASVAVAPSGQAHIFATGPDGALWHLQYSGSWGCVGGGVIKGTPAAVAFGSNIQLFVRWADDSIRTATYDGTPSCCNWSTSAANLGGVTVTDPVATFFNNQIHVLIGGQGPSFDVYENYANVGSPPLVWSGWHLFDPQTAHIVGKPAVAVFNGYLYVVVRAPAPNNMLYMNTESTTGGLSHWTVVPGSPTGASDPAVSSFNNQLQVVVYGTDAAVHEEDYSTVLGWAGWQNLEGHLIGNPNSVGYVIPVQPYPKQFHIFVQGTGGSALWDHLGSTWTSLGGVITDDPVGAVFSGQIHVMARGQDGVLYEWIYGNGSWSGYASLGGQIA